MILGSDAFRGGAFQACLYEGVMIGQEITLVRTVWAAC